MLIAIGCIYVGFVLLIAVIQRQLLFFPTRESERVMLINSATLGMEPWRDASGAIIGWKLRRDRSALAANKLLVFHGNAGHALHRDDYARSFEAFDGGRKWEVWLFEYPGYGARAGTPNRSAFAKAARDAATQLRALDSRPLLLLGESIGSGVACDLAAEPSNHIAGLVLITPMARLSDVAQMHFWFVPVRLILRDRWDNVAALSSFAKPTALLAAGRDEVMGPAQADVLFEKVPGLKRRWLFPDATHNDTEIQRADWAGEVSDFLLGGEGANR